MAITTEVAPSLIVGQEHDEVGWSFLLGQYETEKNAIIARESAAIDFMLIPLVIKRLEVWDSEKGSERNT